MESLSQKPGQFDERFYGMWIISQTACQCVYLPTYPSATIGSAQSWGITVYRRRLYIAPYRPPPGLISDSTPPRTRLIPPQMEPYIYIGSIHPTRDPMIVWHWPRSVVIFRWGPRLGADPNGAANGHIWASICIDYMSIGNRWDNIN